jgi:nitrate reductase alpha subunit
VVRSTHGVNCTGSCSWRVYVKDGIITWETQAVDYPSIGPSSPEYEPRGCRRGASFSWYTYSLTFAGALASAQVRKGLTFLGRAFPHFLSGPGERFRVYARYTRVNAQGRGGSVLLT